MGKCPFRKVVVVKFKKPEHVFWHVEERGGGKSGGTFLFRGDAEWVRDAINEKIARDSACDSNAGPKEKRNES